MLKIGRKAPAFVLLDQDGKTQSLKEQAGKWVLIYFYPKDDTPGCTKEARMIAEVYGDFKRLGVTVFGVSKDSVKSHKKFALKHNLPFVLLADTESIMLTSYDVLVEKSMFGKKYLGIARVSYVINPEGKIAAIYPDVDPASHALTLLADIKTLKKATKVKA